MKYKNKQKSELAITILVVVGILAVLNFVSYKIFTHLDLTENKNYSLSKVSKKTVGDLKEAVNIKVYFSNDLPTQFIGLRQEVKDILSEYEAFSGGKVKLEYISPAEGNEVAKEMAEKGIPQLTFQTYEKDKAQVVNGYMGMTIAFQDKTETIPVIEQDTSNLEYQITSTIKKISSEDIASVAFLTSNGTANLQNQMSNAYEALSKLYTVETIDLEKSTEIAPEIDTLIIAGPKTEFKEEQLKSINAFVARGGKLLVLIDGVLVGQDLSAELNKTGLETLLEKYGVKVNSDLVGDVRNAVASFNQGFMTFSTNYPYWLKITSEGFASDKVAVASLENVILPWTSSLEIVAGKEKSVMPLAFTSGKAWQEKENFNLAPNNFLAKVGNKKYSVAAIIDGEIDNAYPSEGAEKMTGKIIVVGDSDFVYNNGNADNLTFFQNLVDSLSLDEDLINIRAKTVTSRPIKEDLSDSERGFIRYGNIFGVTIVVIIFGMSRYYLRRKSRLIDEF